MTEPMNPDELLALADRLDHRATQNAIVRSYGIMPSSHTTDDDLDRAAAAVLRATASDNHGDTDERVRAELDEYPCFMDLMEMQERLAPLADYLDALGFDHDAELVRRMLFPAGTVAELRAERDAAVAQAVTAEAEVQQLRDAIGEPDELRVWVDEHNSIMLRKAVTRIADAVAAVSSGAATPTTCPTCGSDDPTTCHQLGDDPHPHDLSRWHCCPDTWHNEAAT